MFRKTLIATTALAAIATALVPATASAKSFKGGWGHGWGYGAGLAIIGAGLAYSASCYQVVQTRNGDFVRVYVC